MLHCTAHTLYVGLDPDNQMVKTWPPIGLEPAHQLVSDSKPIGGQVPNQLVSDSKPIGFGFQTNWFGIRNQLVWNPKPP
jgi:hypothetical protein